MILQSTKHQCSALGCVMTSQVLSPPLDHDTSSHPTSLEGAETARQHFHYTAVERSHNYFGPLGQVGKAESCRLI